MLKTTNSKNQSAVELGKRSASKRFEGKTQEEISEIMRELAKKPRGKRKKK